MRRYLTIKRINYIAWKLLQDVGIKKPSIDPNQVAEFLKIKVEEGDLGDDISGLLAKKDKEVIIGVNTHHPNRQRFTIAHEIGHFVLGHERNGMFIDEHKQHFSLFYRNEQSSEGTNQQEIEANAFAAALLMPEPFVKDEIQKLLNQGEKFDLSDLSMDNIEFISRLADEFKVSQMAMTYRIGNLNLFNTI